MDTNNNGYKIDTAKDIQALKTTIEVSILPWMRAIDEDVKGIHKQVYNHIPTALGDIQRIMIGNEDPKNIKHSIYSRLCVLDQHRGWLRFKPRTLLLLLLVIVMIVLVILHESLFYGFIGNVLLKAFALF